ncbi:ras guanine nucleotide exchange factor domain-containing protein [Blakeslea trispora]|nr:ras guanine nucleotide exchange factor domain-containing protein [Blakeslea trispora]
MSGVRVICRVQALYSFQSNDPSSLSFAQDDFIDVLNKLPSGWWDGLCNGIRGWFPSNYVKIIEEEPRDEDEMFSPNQEINKHDNDSRFSLAYNNTTQTLESPVQDSPWVMERTEDGSGIYYYNTVTGEMKSGNDEDDHTIDHEYIRAESTIMADSEYESDQVSTIDLPGWSDQSTVHSSIEDKWINRVTLQQGRPYSSDVQSLLSRASDIKQYSAPPQLLPRSPSRRPSVRRIDATEPLSWTKLSSTIAVALHQLTSAAKNGQHNLYYKNSIEIVNSIRFMLIASSTIDKDSTYIKANSALRSHHRAMMASMSKLVLTTQTSHTAFSTEEEHRATTNKILSESSELLMMVRNFVNTCQDLKLPLVHADPQWIEDEEDIYSRRPSSSSNRYSLQINLAESLETMGTCIQDSAETIIKCISFFLLEREDRKINLSQDDRTSLAALLFTHFRNLSNQTGLFLGYLDETDFSGVQQYPELNELKAGKQALADGLGLLFYRLQSLTGGSAFDFYENLRETESASGSLFEPIEQICASVHQLAIKNRSRNSSNASFLGVPDPKTLSKKASSLNTDESIIPEDIEEEDEARFYRRKLGDEDGETASFFDDNGDRVRPSVELMDRHKSELALQSQPPLPYPMQRSQTAPLTKQAVSSKVKKLLGDEAPSNSEEVITPAKPATEERPAFLEYDYGPNDIVFNMEGNVKGGTLPALVERLTLHDYLDMSFINTFLLTYRSFCSSMELMDLLEARYNLKCPEGLDENDAAIWQEKKLKLVRLRVFNVMKSWLESYYYEDDSVLLDRLLEFTQTSIRKTLKFSNGQLESLIEKRRATKATENGSLKKMILTLPDPPEPILPKNRRRFKLLDIDALEMARQLTIMDFKFYSAIRPIECLDKAWSIQDDVNNVAVNIRASIEYCNQVTSWVSDVILSQTDIKKRSVLIKYWVQVAERCRALNNFNTCMAILSAFDNSSVGRLKRTWEAVGTRTTQVLQDIRKLMGANRNFNAYRVFIHSINPPCIPFLGIYLQDLTFIEDGNSNELKKSKDLINFAKRAKTAEVIREIQQYQSSLYQLKPVDELQDFIKHNLKSTRDEEQLYKESLKLEPREREDEKITRLLQESGFL